MSTAAIPLSSSPFYQSSPHESFIQKWAHHDREIHLVRRQNDLWFVVHDSKTHRVLREDKIETRGNSIDKTIDLLSKCEVVTGQDDVAIPKRLSSCSEWPFPLQAYNLPNAHVTLMRRANELIWRIFDQNTKCAKSITAHNNLNLQEYLRNTPTGAEDAYLKDFAVTLQFEGTTTEKIQSIVISKLLAPSRLASYVILDRDSWAVTLISRGASSGLCEQSIDPGFGHAMIAYEGIREGRRFIEYAHFRTDEENSSLFEKRGKGELLKEKDVLERNASKNVISNEFAYSAKSPTWNRSRDKVMRMINEIEQKKLIRFNQTGTSWFSLTWLYERPQQFTWNIGKLIWNGIEGGYEQVKADPFLVLCPPMSPSTATGRWLAKNVLFKLHPEFDKPIEIDGVRYENALEIHDQKMALYELEQRKKTKETIDSIEKNYAESLSLIGMNCLTQARDYFLLMDIELPTFESFIEAPTRYIQWLAENPNKVILR